MEFSVFEYASGMPDEAALKKALGDSFIFWQDIKDTLTDEYGEFSEEWKCPMKKHGWGLRLKKKKRNIIYLGPLNGYFRIAFILGDRAVLAVEDSALPDSIKEELKSSKKYMEGKIIRLEVRSPEDVKIIKILARIKMEN
ncbi:DUF3788 domain-containing protein [candidate division KSB1 bacterium]